MGILDSGGIGKLQERFFGKSDQNKIVGLKLGKTLPIARYFADCIQFCVPEDQTNPFGSCADYVEDSQINMLGSSKKLFLESILGQFQRDQAVEAENNKK